MSRIYKIKHLKLSKVFRGAVTMGIVPAVIQLVSAVITTISANSGIQGTISSILYCLLMPIVIGIGCVALGAAYNWLSPKIGQFEIELEEVEK